MTKPTFSILTDSIDNTNLAIKQFFQISLERGVLTEEGLRKMDEEIAANRAKEAAGLLPDDPWE
jgi:hypothetical protein